MIHRSFIKILFICYLAALITGCNYLELVEEQYLNGSPKKSCVLMGEIKEKGGHPDRFWW